MSSTWPLDQTSFKIITNHNLAVVLNPECDEGRNQSGEQEENKINSEIDIEYEDGRGHEMIIHTRPRIWSRLSSSHIKRQDKDRDKDAS